MRLIAFIAALLLAAIPAAAQPGTGDAWAMARSMKRGVNIIGYDPLWTDRAKGRFQTKHFARLREGGFDFVRVNLHSFRHMDKDGKLPPVWFETLDWVVKEATAAGLTVILDEHDFMGCEADPDACETRLAAFWTQVGTRYKDAPNTVLFELLNEPHGRIDAARWNAMLEKLIPLVRATNPKRTLVIGPVFWNNLDYLPTLKLPKADRNILVTFHSYEPFQFTHQGASWATGMKDVRGIPFTKADEARIKADYDKVAAWSKAEDRPMLMGEFGAYEGAGTPMEDRARYTATVRREAEAHGFPWAYWQFDSNFLLWDMAKDDWVRPIHKALIPD